MIIPRSHPDNNRAPSSDGAETAPILPRGTVYALDRGLPLGRAWLALAHFRGSSRAATRAFTRSVAPRLAGLALARWQTTAGSILGGADPFLLCLARGEVREGLRLLVAEWMEFRRLVPGCRWRLVIRTCPVALEQPDFELVAPFWQQVRALRGQLGVRRSSAYLWVRAEDDAGDECLLDAARALVVVARGQGFADPVALALARGKPVLAPRPPDDTVLPADYPYQFATRPAVLRFVGEPRRRDTASVAWPVPEPLALAHVIRSAVLDPAALAAAGRRVAVGQVSNLPLTDRQVENLPHVAPDREAGFPTAAATPAR